MDATQGSADRGHRMQNGWFDRNRAKLAGFVLGSLGTIVLTLFLVVVITGEPYGRSFEPAANVIYPNY